MVSRRGGEVELEASYRQPTFISFDTPGISQASAATALEQNNKVL